MAEADPHGQGPQRAERRGGALDRRQLLKVGAWAAPAILLATAAPAQAAVSGPIVPEDTVRLTTNCQPTTGRETRHGFTLSNGSSDTVTVEVVFTATASGIGPIRALQNVISITSTDLAQYPVTQTGGGGLVPADTTYKTIWEVPANIHVVTTGIRSSASREGTATYVLPPGASVTILQINTNIVGEGRLTGKILKINGVGVNGSIALFGFELGGDCIAVGPG